MLESVACPLPPKRLGREQLRAPFETLLDGLANLSGFKPGEVTAIGETSLSDLKIRPDYSVTVQSALVGFVEVKAPGKGADPRRFKDKHDKEQWEKLKQIPNLIYTDGNDFSLWHSGELVSIVRLAGDVATSGNTLSGGLDLVTLFGTFLQSARVKVVAASFMQRVVYGFRRRGC